MSLDASIPTLATLGDALAEIHRETRAAVNANAVAILAGTLPGMTNEVMQAAAQVIDVAGSIAINITMAGPPNNLVNIVNGYDGQFVILRVDEGEVGQLTVVHNPLLINLQENVNFVMQAGDILGAWVFRDIQDAFNRLIWTIDDTAASVNLDRYRGFGGASSEAGGTWLEAQSDAVADWQAIGSFGFSDA